MSPSIVTMSQCFHKNKSGVSLVWVEATLKVVVIAWVVVSSHRLMSTEAS